MYNISRGILSFILPFICINVFGQKGGGGVGIRANPIIQHDTKFMYDDFVYRNIDTSIYDFHRYTPMMRAEFPAFNLGNPGQKYHSIFFQPWHQTGFQSGQDLFRLYFRDVEDARYFDTKTPFTDLSLAVGQTEEVAVRGIHTQNVNEQLNFGVDYERFGSKGAYSRNKGVVQNLLIHGWFRSKNRGYHFMPTFSLNKAVIEENGGLAVENVFEVTTNRTRENIDINLQNAENTRSIKALNFQHFIIPKLLRRKNDTTSVGVDTSALAERFRIGISTKLVKNNFSYIDNQQKGASIYENFFYSENGTIDSFKLRQLEQEFSFHEHFKIGSIEQEWKTGLTYQLTNYQQYELNRNIHDFYITTSWHINPQLKQRFSNKLTAQLHLSPNFAGDFNIANNLRLQINNMMSLQWLIQINHRSPTIKEEVWRSNHFYYYNSFNKEKIISNTLLFHCNRGHINGELSHHLIKDFIFSGENVFFEQSAELLQIVTFKANKLFDFKNFGLFTEIISQYNSNKEVLSVPVFYLRQSIFYKGGFFSGKVNANLGLDIWYHTNYKVYDYNPALSEFFLQRRQTEKYLPVVDAFFDIQINRARVFLMMQNVAQGIGQNGYYVALNHPGQDRAFKAGVRWQFYD